MTSTTHRTRRSTVGETRFRSRGTTLDRLAPAVISAAFLVLYLALRVKALNLDGLGYAGRVASNDPRQLLLPGHLMYGPILHLVYQAVGFVWPSVDAARLMQTCDCIFAAAGLGVFVSALRKLSVSAWTAALSALSLGFTYTYWVHGTDLTTYAFSTFCLICALHILCSAKSIARPPSVWAVGGMVALATLIHQSNLVFLPAAMIGVYGTAKTGLRKALMTAAVAVVLIAVPYGLLGWVATGGTSPVAIVKWAAQGAHGYAPTFEPVNLVRGVYGFTNAVVYLDDAGTTVKGSAAHIAGSAMPMSSMLRLAAKAGFVFVLIGMPTAALVRRPRLGADQRWAARVCAVWIVPYALVALVFFTTDHDRWIMLLPAVITLAGIAYPKPTMRGRYAAAVAVALLCALNLASAIYPSHLGTNSRCYQEAKRLAPMLENSDLLFFWGHGHMGTSGYLRQIRPVEAVHVVDMSLKTGREQALVDLTRMARTAAVSGRRVLVIGLYGTSDAAGDYLSEAHALGLTRAQVLEALSGFIPRRAFVSGPDVAYELTPKGAAHG